MGMKKLIATSLIFLYGCNLSSNSGAIAFLWNEEPSASSTKIMVVSDLDENQLRSTAIENLDNLGFIVEELNEDEIITEPKDMGDNLMRMSLEINNNVIIISGDQGTMNRNEEIDWKAISRGEERDQDAYASPEWELMNVLASSISNNSILYN
jgi:hypothetical protein